MRKYEVIYYFFFTNSGNVYPKQQVDEFKSIMRENRALWTRSSSSGEKPKLRPVIMTSLPQIDSLTRIRYELNLIGQELWQMEDFCVLSEAVQT